MAHTSHASAALEGRLVDTDKFYTPHSLAAQVRKISSEQISYLGTVRLNRLGNLNKQAVLQAQSQLKDDRAWPPEAVSGTDSMQEIELQRVSATCAGGTKQRLNCLEGLQHRDIVL